jgi:hypothetical protein
MSDVIFSLVRNQDEQEQPSTACGLCPPLTISKQGDITEEEASEPQQYSPQQKQFFRTSVGSALEVWQVYWNPYLRVINQTYTYYATWLQSFKLLDQHRRSRF